MTILVILALGLRMWGLNYGLPDLYYVDESVFVDAALRIAITGDLNPGWFGHPGSTFIYLLAIIYKVYFMVGGSLDAYPSAAAFSAEVTRDPSVVYLLGRFVAAVFGALSVGLVYTIGRRHFNPTTGVAAALFLAVSPLHGTFSQIARTDSLAALLILGVCYFALRMLRRTTSHNYLIAGSLVGLAVATKWPLALAAWLPLSAHAVRQFVGELDLHASADGKAHAIKVGRLAVLQGLGAFVLGSIVLGLAPALLLKAHFLSPTSMLNGLFTLELTLTQLAILGGSAGLALLRLLSLKSGIGLGEIARPFLDKRLLLLAAAAGIGFLAAAPYTVYDLRQTAGSLIEESRPHPGAERLPGIQNHLWYATDAAPQAVGYPVAIFALAGIVRGLLLRRRESFLLSSFILAYWLFVGSLTLHWVHWIIPVLPLLCLLAADTMLSTANSLKAFLPRQASSITRPLTVLVTILLAWLPLTEIIVRDSSLTSKDTREYATEWVNANIPAGSKIVQELKSGRFDPDRFEITPVSNYPAQDSFASLIDNGYDYVVLSSVIFQGYLSDPIRYPSQSRFYDEVTRNATLLQEFTPSKATRPGPTIKIYRLPGPITLDSRPSSDGAGLLSSIEVYY